MCMVNFRIRINITKKKNIKKAGESIIADQTRAVIGNRAELTSFRMGEKYQLFEAKDEPGLIREKSNQV